MSRREAVCSVRWNDNLKLGEHEDFFLRFCHANQTVYTCRYIDVHYHHTPWWQRRNSSYYRTRTRIFAYHEQILISHNLRKLINFNYLCDGLDN